MAYNVAISQVAFMMKQLGHEDILPFYGVSITVSKFCLSPGTGTAHSSDLFSLVRWGERPQR